MGKIPVPQIFLSKKKNDNTHHPYAHARFLFSVRANQTLQYLHFSQNLSAIQFQEILSKDLMAVYLSELQMSIPRLVIERTP